MVGKMPVEKPWMVGELPGHTGRVTELNRQALERGQEQVAETRQTYDLIASEFARQNSVAAAEVAERLDELAASVPAGSVVADIGCGPGRDVMMLNARGMRAAGIDLSLGQLRASAVPGLVQADMRRLPLRAGSVDGIWCWVAAGAPASRSGTAGPGGVRPYRT
jgi:SAM-dependent methyltransferase